MEIVKTIKSLKIQIIDRYIIGKFLRTYAFAILMIIAIVIIFDAAEKIDDFLESEASLWKILTSYYLNFIPFFVNQFSGLFTFIAVIFFTSKMAYNTEIIAILSSGVSFLRMLYPYLISALCICILSLSLNLFIIPSANQRRIKFEREYLSKNNQRKDIYDRFIYRQVAPNTFTFIRDFNNKQNKASYFVLETYEHGKVVSSLEASDVTYNKHNGTWGAKKYITRTFQGDIEFLDKVNKPLDTVINLVPEELGRVEELIQTMNSAVLSRFIDAQEAKGSDMVALFKIESNSRYAYPISTFILTLIGAALSSRKSRGGTGFHIGMGIGLCFSYVLLMRFATEFAKSGSVIPEIAIWFPNILYLAIGIYLYRVAPK